MLIKKANSIRTFVIGMYFFSSIEIHKKIMKEDTSLKYSKIQGVSKETWLKILIALKKQVTVDIRSASALGNTVPSRDVKNVRFG